jgi:hypothetical protein
MAKQKRRRKNRFRLLLYNRFLGRYRILSFLIFIVLLVSWFAISTKLFVLPFNNISGLFLSGAILFFGFWFFTILGPLLAFAQAHDDHLLLQTPLYRLRIPYQQILNTRPVEVRKIFVPSSLSVGQHILLKPHFQQTALAVDLHSLPPPNFALRLFFHRFTFSPESTGIILLVDDWMGLSNQLSVKVDTWRMAHSDHPTQGASDAANILRDN